MIGRSIILKRTQESAKKSLEVLKSKIADMKIQSKPYVTKFSSNMKVAKEKSIVGIGRLSDWMGTLINRTTGYDQISKIEENVNECESKFEYTTKHLRELNTDYLNHQQRVMNLQMERTELMMKPKRTFDENQRLAELVANENEWEQPLSNVRKEYLDLFELQKKQLEEYKDGIYHRYYEERAWEQKIRRLGQYSYVAMLGLNLVTFGYTRYDRKRIRQNMEYTDALSKQIADVRQTQNEVSIENNRLLLEVREMISERESTFSASDKKDETTQEGSSVKKESNEDRRIAVAALNAAVTAITNTSAVINEEKTHVVDDIIAPSIVNVSAGRVVNDSIETNAIILVLSSAVTMAFMALLTR